MRSASQSLHNVSVILTSIAGIPSLSSVKKALSALTDFGDAFNRLEAEYKKVCAENYKLRLENERLKELTRDCQFNTAFFNEKAGLPLTTPPNHKE